MIDDVGAVRRQLKVAARKYDQRAEEATQDALREYYRGRADGARAAANSLSRIEVEAEDLDVQSYINNHETNT